MHRLLLPVAALALAACSSGGDEGFGSGGVPVASCSNDGQKQFVVDAMQDWYFWEDRLPATVDISQFATPGDVLEFLKTFSPTGSDGRPVDEFFSFLTTASADQQRFAEGKFEGFGFNSRFVGVDDLRLVRVYEDSPANRGGLARGQQFVTINGRTIAQIQAAEGVGALFALPTLDVTMRETDGTEFTVTIDQGEVTIDPVPQFRIIDAGGGRNVGYLELASFISTADSVLSDAFGQFRAAGVNDIILDVRYNGGGLVSTANLLGDLLGGDVAENLIFSKTVFNQNRAENDSTEFFERRLNSASLSRLVVITTSSSGSASELVPNSMEPHVDVTLVGSTTSGKPVGQVGLEFCGNLLRAVAFQTLNADDFGDYFDGLPVDCAAPDNLNIPVGDAADPEPGCGARVPCDRKLPERLAARRAVQARCRARTPADRPQRPAAPGIRRRLVDQTASIAPSMTGVAPRGGPCGVFLKWLGYFLAGIAGLAIVAIAFIWIGGGRIVDKVYDLPASTFVSDPAIADLEEGKRLAIVRGCYDGCHGEGAGGDVFNDDLVFGRITAPDLTRAFTEMSDVEIDRVVRLGVRRDGRSTLVMPSASFYSLSDSDLNNIVSFIRSEPLANGPDLEVQVGIAARLFLVIGEFWPQVEEIRRDAPWISDADTDPELRHGKYLALTICAECHGMDLKGIPDFAPALAAAVAYPPGDFKRLMREGIALGDRELGLMSGKWQ